MKYLKKAPVYLLSLIFVVFSLQFFVMMFTGSAQMPPMNPLATDFMNVLFLSGYVWIVKTLELTLGILIAIPRTRNLALILIAPIVVNIFLVEILIVQPPFVQTIPALLVTISAIIAIYQRREVYMPMIRKENTETKENQNI